MTGSGTPYKRLLGDALVEVGGMHLRPRPLGLAHRLHGLNSQSNPARVRHSKMRLESRHTLRIHNCHRIGHHTHTVGSGSMVDSVRTRHDDFEDVLICRNIITRKCL